MIDSAASELVKALAGPIVALIAAGGAWYFANAQVTVAREQRAIAETQARIADEKMRLELFNKRFDVFAACRDMLKYISSSNIDNLDEEIMIDFQEKINHSIFLFGKSTLCEIDEIIRHSHLVILAKSCSEPDQYGDLCVQAFDKLRELPEFFAPYMRFDEISPGRGKSDCSEEATP